MAPVVCNFPAAGPGVVVRRQRNVLKPRVRPAVAMGETRLWIVSGYPAAASRTIVPGSLNVSGLRMDSAVALIVHLR